MTKLAAWYVTIVSRVVIRGFVAQIGSTNPRIFFRDVEFEDSRIHHRSQQTTNIRDSSTNHEYDSITRKNEYLSIIADTSNNAEKCEYSLDIRMFVLRIFDKTNLEKILESFVVRSNELRISKNGDSRVRITTLP